MATQRGETRKGTFYRGQHYQLYSKRRNKWIRLAFAGTVIPIITSFWVSLNVETASFIELLGNGDIILSLFALTLPMVFDVFEEKRRYDDGLSNAFLACIFLLVVQVLTYCTIKKRAVEIKGATDAVRWLIWNDMSQTTITYVENIVGIVFWIVVTTVVCLACISAMEVHSERITEEESENHG